MKPKAVKIDYWPREPFWPFHERTQRWACLVCHRRAGKTVAAINDLLRAAVLCKSRNPLFAYVAPYRAQAKSVAWGYLKEYAKPITKNVNESDLIVTLRTGAEIRIFGADNPDALRGLGFDGVFLDEYGDFKPSVWGSVVRPALADKQGWAVFAGTPKGKNQFWKVWDQARSSPEDWFAFMLKASDSGILAQTELNDARKTSSEDQYLQEYECSFEAAILGAYYGTEIRELEEQGRIGSVPYDPSLPTYTAWDLGHRDDTAVWWYQVVRGEIHIIDFYSESGADPDIMAKLVMEKPYHYGQHILPHDARAKTFSSGGRSTIEMLAESMGGISMFSIAPNLSVQDGIQASRMMLKRCWFDAIKCKEGIEALRQYEREYDEDKKAFRQTPKHNWCSHPADAFRMAAVSWQEEQPQARVFPDRPLIVGPGNEATLNDMWAAHKRQKRSARI